MRAQRVQPMCGHRAHVPQRKRQARGERQRRVLRAALGRLREQRALFYSMSSAPHTCRMTQQETMVFMYAALRAVALGERVWDVPMLDFCLDAGEYLGLDPDDVMRTYMRLEKKGVFVNPEALQQQATQLELPLEGGGNG